jgi:Zn-dependent M28 family amino/carboxypeptidase
MTEQVAASSQQLTASSMATSEAALQIKNTMQEVAFGAEEHGLIGSEIYCRNPTMGDIKQHVFMLNLDMIGRNPYKPVEIIGVGSAAGNALSNICKEAIQMIGLDAVLKPMPDLDGGDSDHSSFYAVGVPFVALFTGLHADYHRVTDHHTHIDYNRAAKIAQVGLYIVKSIADAEYRLQHVGR